MYETYYNLKAMPFQITTDPRFLWLGEKHSEALATLKYGIMQNKGFLLLTGAVGTGNRSQNSGSGVKQSGIFQLSSGRIQNEQKI